MSIRGFEFPVFTAPPARKLVTGHYVHFLRFRDTHSHILGCKRDAPGIKGYMRRFTWVSLEPTQGNYYWTELDDELAFAAANGLILVPMLEDKTFTNEEDPMPPYMWSLSAPIKANIGDGHTGARWDQRWTDRLKALITAMALRYDDNPAFAGLAIQETSLGKFPEPCTAAPPRPPDGVPPYDYVAYTTAKHRDAYINVIQHARTAFKKSVFWWHFNFFKGEQSYIGSVLNAIKGDYATAGGPDILPDSPNLTDAVYPFYETYKGTLPFLIHAQTDSYRHYHAGTNPKVLWSMDQLFVWAVNNLHIKTFLWTYQENRPEPFTWKWTDAVPVIAKYPAPFNASYPMPPDLPNPTEYESDDLPPAEDPAPDDLVAARARGRA